MNHKNDRHFLLVGLLLPSLLNLLRLGFDINIPHPLTITLLIISIATLLIYAARYRKAKQSESTTK